MAFFIGLDVSTTRAKALLLDEKGKVGLGIAEEYSLQRPHHLWAEQDPEDWWLASGSAIRRLLISTGVRPMDVAAIGLTGQMFGLTALNAAGRPIRPCMIWNDQRAGDECEEITRQVGLARLIELTANSMLPGYVAPKLLWLRRHEPETYNQIAHLLVAKDYVRYRMTGDLCIDVTDASGTALFDVAHRGWSDEMLHHLEIPREWLPPSFESPTVTGKVSRLAAEAIGLRPGTLVVAGAGDQPAQAVGSGIVEPGRSSVTLGTSGVVFVATPGPVVHPRGILHAFCHAVPGTWCLMGVVMSAGASLKWYRDNLGQTRQAASGAGIDPYELLTAEARNAPPGCEGLLFLPYLTGERTPHVDPKARGGWIGLTSRHGSAHLVRAILEGVGFALRDALAAVEALYSLTGQVLVSGGGARSPLWRQILAEILGRELLTVNETEGAALGAAILAAVGVGAFPSVSAACRALIQVESRIEPDAENTRRYDHLYEIYRDLYPAVCSANHRLSDQVMKGEPFKQEEGQA